jgi:hypothetical protein
VQQELELTDTNKYGAEDNVQTFKVPSINELSKAQQAILAEHGNHVLLEFKKDDMGHWLLKIEASKPAKPEQAHEQIEPQNNHSPVAAAKNAEMTMYART